MMLIKLKIDVIFLCILYTGFQARVRAWEVTKSFSWQRKTLFFSQGVFGI